MGEFEHEGFRLAYEEHGSGDRPIVLVHGLLLSRKLFDRIAPVIADRGNRVICLDLLGHGESDRPTDLQRYSMPLFAQQIEALLDHLGLQRAVVGGTSLGANATLELATRSPERVEGLVIEMPVLDNALAAVTAFFGPLLLSLRFGRPAFELLSGLTSRLPRTHPLIDLMLDTVRQRPGPSTAVLEGLLMGETAPRREERRAIEQPVLVIGHSGDPLHPLSDSGTLVDELSNARMIGANSLIEWRLWPDRLNQELALFLDQVWNREEGREPDEQSAGA